MQENAEQLFLVLAVELEGAEQLWVAAALELEKAQ